MDNLVTIEKRLLKYIPKKAQKYLTWLDGYKDRYVSNYQVAFDLSEFDPDAGEDWQAYCDSVEELRWAASQFYQTYIKGKKNVAHHN